MLKMCMSYITQNVDTVVRGMTIAVTFCIYDYSNNKPVLLNDSSHIQLLLL